VILLTTVKHSGTHSLLEVLGKDNVELRHCCPGIFEDIEQWDSIATTYRDPYRIAASWANRGFFKPDYPLGRTWYVQWENWHKVKPLATVYPVDEIGHRLNSSEDVLRVHQALDDGDMNHFYRYVPKEAIEYALQ